MEACNGKWSDWQQHQEQSVDEAESAVSGQRPQAIYERVVRDTTAPRQNDPQAGREIWARFCAATKLCHKERPLMLQCGSKRKMRAKNSRHW